MKSELIPTLRIAVPVVLAELGWMGMGIVDTIMVSPLGPSAIGAVGVGTSLHMALAIFGMGVLLGLDTLVSQAYGAREIGECRTWLLSGAALALALTAPVVAISLIVLLAIPLMGFHADVMPRLQVYFAVVLWSTPCLLLYAACRRYLQGVHIVSPIMFALVSANAVNAGANWALIYGNLGLPALGVAGAAWATLLSRAYLFAVLGAAIWWHERHRGFEGWTVASVRGARIRRLVELGVPAASQITLEVGVFAVATMLAGMLDPVSSASHQIALNLAGAAFMVPLGIASAGAVRVAHAIGARDPKRAAASGWTALALGAAFMTASGLAFLMAPRLLIGLFTRDAAVLTLGSSLLSIAALFQLFDGLQGVATGTLRGLGDTRTPMMVNLAAHWLVGLPVGYLLCFTFGWGVGGLWWGLSVGLIVTGAMLLHVWTRRIAAVQRRV